MTTKRIQDWDILLRNRYKVSLSRVLSLGGFLMTNNIDDINVRIVPRRPSYRRRCKVYIIIDDNYLRRWSLSQRRLKYFRSII